MHQHYWDKDINPLVAAIVKDMNTGLKDFGTYAFDDEGTSATMYLSDYVDQLAQMDAVVARNILEELARHSTNASRVAHALVGELDSQPEAWFDTLLDSDLLEY